MKTDIEISNESKLLPINVICNKIGLTDEQYELYGKYKAKVNFLDLSCEKKDSKLILVTSINPTISGEGKTTVSIGICDALNRLGYLSIATLREPSLGPVFGRKGGACGGGFSQVVPMDDINLHFTGDFHAITTCNNLLCSVIDDHIFHGNKLSIDPSKIVFHRCIDLNDRFLRNVSLNVKDFVINEKFDITAASEIMAIFCLAKDYVDLRKRLENIIVAYSYNDEPIFARDLNCIGSMLVVLKDALKPNLVQTLEHSPVFVHGGPFANIAHGCCSLVSTRFALNYADYVVTEAGFGSDLGAEKFFDIKCRYGNLVPNVIVINVTLKSIKNNGNGDLISGLKLLRVHIDNMKKYLDNIIVCLNKFSDDLLDDIEFVRRFCSDVEFSVCDSFVNGSLGALDLAKKVVDLSNRKVSFNYLYDLNISIEDKINKICCEIYRANGVNYSSLALNKIKKISNEFSKLPICIAKTPYSLSDNDKLIGITENFNISVSDVKVNNGAGFIVVYLSNILTLPGLGENANLYNIDLIDGRVVGLN